jgi:hypothetical protein
VNLLIWLLIAWSLFWGIKRPLQLVSSVCGATLSFKLHEKVEPMRVSYGADKFNQGIST